MLTNGLDTILADELHFCETGINTLAQYAMMNWAVRTTCSSVGHGAALRHLIAVNPAGHRYFVSHSLRLGRYVG